MRIWKVAWVCCQIIFHLPGLFHKSEDEVDLVLFYSYILGLLIYNLFRDLSHLDSYSQAIPG